MDNKEDNKIEERIKIAIEAVALALRNFIRLGRPEYVHLVIVWIIGTFCLSIFESYPILKLQGPKDTGKSTLLKFILGLLINVRYICGTTVAALRKIIKIGKILLLDEGCGLDDKKKLALLRASYQRTGGQYLIAGRGEDEVISASTYTAIAMATYEDIPDEPTESRCITIFTVRR